MAPRFSTRFSTRFAPRMRGGRPVPGAETLGTTAGGAALALALALVLGAPATPASATDVAAADVAATDVAAAEMAAEPAPLSIDLTAGVQVETLDNGLTVVAIPDRRAPVVTHMIWYRAGAADEPTGKSGIAHYLEHLLFKGTPNVPVGEFSGAVAANGGQENAFTSQDATAYFQRITPGLLPTVMAYEADRMVNLELTEAMIATEREVIKEERAQRLLSSPGAELAVATDATLFANHPYGTPVIGWPDEIASLTAEDALDFYRRFYRPDNAVVVVAGDVDPEEVFELAAGTYGAVRVDGAAPERVRPTEPEIRATRTVELEDVRASRPSLRVTWLAPVYRTAKAGEAEAIDLLAEILSGSSTSRLYRRLVVEDQVAAGAGAFYDGNARDIGRFGLAITPADAVSVEEAEEAIRAEVERIAEEGVTQGEIDRARDRLLVSVAFARDSQAAMARIFGAAFTGGSTLEDIRAWPDRMAAVTPDDVREAARRFTGEDFVRSILRPADRTATRVIEPTPPTDALPDPLGELPGTEPLAEPLAEPLPAVAAE